jgi:hypothetical protein
MEHFEDTALDTADHKPAKWLRYVDNSVVVWPHGQARLQQFLHHHNSVRRPTIRFTAEVETDDAVPFWDILVMKRGPKLAMKVYWKLAHLHFKSRHPHQVKRGVHSLIS